MKHLSISILLIICSVNFSAQVKFSPDTIKEIDLSELKEVTIKKGNEKPFITTENFPEFPGGKEALKKFIDKNLKYKAEYRSDTLVTDVIARFVVSKTGTITEPKILKGENTDFAKAVIKAINIMPEWKPGRQCGLHVPVYYSILIQYDAKKENHQFNSPVLLLKTLIVLIYPIFYIIF